MVSIKMNEASSSSSTNRATVVGKFEDLLQKCEASLMPAMEEHVSNEAFNSAKDGLDFLEVKNSLLLTYLIDLTYSMRERCKKKHDQDNFRRLVETRTVLDKIRPLEKKMRYQLDKLLTATSSASNAFVVASTDEDPLTYRPDPTALMANDNGGSDDDDDSDDDDSDLDDDDDDDDDMDDLEAAKATLEQARRTKQNDAEEEEQEDGIYRAPRLTSMPYLKSSEGDEKEKLKRRNQRLRQSELAQMLRAEHGEAPEQSDIHGGSEYGKQREAARRMAEREMKKLQVEEDHMIRLTTSRKEKKERKRLDREESSNLAAIANLGNLVRGVSSAFSQDDNDSDDIKGDGRGDVSVAILGRYSNGKRKRDAGGESGRTRQKSGKSREPKNSLQKALYGKEGKSKANRR